MADRYQITKKDDTLKKHLPEKMVRLERMDMILHVYKPKVKRTIQTAAAQVLNTVEENKSFYPRRQSERAKRAQNLYNALGTPSIHNFKAMLRMKMITNNPGTSKDTKTAEKIFSTDIGALKRKTTPCRKPVPVRSDYIKIPKELISTQREVTLCIDAMKVNGLTFPTTVSQHKLRIKHLAFIRKF